MGRGVLALLCALLLAARAAHAAQSGDWRDESRERGFSPFKGGTRPFDPAKNLAFCARHVISVTFDPLVRDYSPIFNQAFKDLRARNPAGGTLRLGPGRFPIASQLEMFSYSCLIGAGRTRTSIRVKGNVKPFRRAGVLRSFETKRVTVSDITIDGNRKAQRTRTERDRYGRYGFFSELTNYLYLRRVGVVNNLGYGFDPHGSKRHWAYYLLLEDCYARNNGLDGFTLDQTFYVGITGSVSVKNGRHGINVVTGTRNIVASGNSMRGNGFESQVGCGMMAQNNQEYGTRHIKFIANEVVDSRKSGLCLNDVRDVQVLRNTFKNKHRKAICYHLSFVRKVQFKGNKCTKTATSEFRTFGSNQYAGVAKGVGVAKVAPRRKPRRTRRVV